MIPKRDIEILVPRETMIEERKILVHGIAKKTTLDPAVRKYAFETEQTITVGYHAGLSKTPTDFVRLVQASGSLNRLYCSERIARHSA